MAASQGRYLPEHPLNAAVRALGVNASPGQRLEVLWRAYEEEHGELIGRPPADEQRRQVYDWLKAMRPGGTFPVFAARVPGRRSTLHLSMSEKAWGLAQSECMSCEVVVGADGKIPLSVVFPVDVERWSRQAAKNAREIREAVHHALTGRGICRPWSDSPLCLTIVALVPSATTMKDADNLVKGLLDSMQGVLYLNDRLVQCLTSRRIEYAGPAGHYVVSARAVHPWDADVVYDHPAAPVIASGTRVLP
jgi:Holliday junction resolvase RusA-like endonuclease